MPPPRAIERKRLSGRGQNFAQRITDSDVFDAAGIYAFKSAALELFQEAQGVSKTTILEQPSAPAALECELLNNEYESHSNWLSGDNTNNEHLNAYSEREQAEWEVANIVLCPSEFVRDGIGQCGGPIERCIVVPYGVDLGMKPCPRLPRADKQRLRVLTVGTVNLHKGAYYTFQAAKQASSIAEFRMVGSVEVSNTARKCLSERIDLVGLVPRSEVKKHYEWADVFLLPSLCEGSATVTYEALAAGLPVICTPNTGSIVRDGQEGFIVPIRNAEAIAEKINELAFNSELYHAMAGKARARYESAGNLQAYGSRLVNVLDNVFDKT